MADANCAVTYDTEDDCCAPDLAGPVIEPPPPELPPEGVPQGNAFALVYAFGDGIIAPIAGSKIVIPSPYIGRMLRWRARVAGDVVGTATFAIRIGADETSVLTLLTGTMPALAAVKGAKSTTTLDWAIVNIIAGNVIEVTYVSGDVLGITLVIECEQQS